MGVFDWLTDKYKTADRFLDKRVWEPTGNWLGGQAGEIASGYNTANRGFTDWLDAHQGVSDQSSWYEAPGSHVWGALGSILGRDSNQPQSVDFGFGSGRATTGGPAHAGLPGGAPALNTSPSSPSGMEGMDEVGRILRRLEGMGDPSRYYASPGELEQQARSAVNSQYNPLIQALRQQKRSTRRLAENDKEELGQMFGALSRSIRGDIPDIRKSGRRENKRINRSYKKLDKDLSGQYAETRAEQEALLKRLGIEEAAPDVFEDQLEDEAFFRNLSRTEAQTERGANRQDTRGDVNYSRQGAQIARQEGTNRRADLMEQLREAMSAYNSQIGQHRTAKSQAYQSALSDLQRQMQEDAQSRAQQDFQNYLDQIRVGMDLRESYAPEEQEPVQLEGPAQIGPYAEQQLGLPESSAKNLQQLMVNVLGQEQFAQNPVSEQTRNKQERVNYILRQGEAQGLSGPELYALADIAYRLA